MLLLGFSLVEASRKCLDLPEVYIVPLMEGVGTSGWVVVVLWGTSTVASNEQETQVGHKNQMLSFVYLMTQRSSYAQGKCYAVTGFSVSVDTIKLLGCFFKESELGTV